MLELKLIKHPSSNIIARKNNEGINFSIVTQIRMLFIIIECYLLNQVFSLLGENEDEILKNKILSGKCYLIINTPEAEITEKLFNLQTIKKYLIISNVIEIDEKFIPFENIIQEKILKLLSYLKEILLENNFYSVPDTNLPKESVQYILYNLKFQDKLSEFAKSKLIYLFSRNDIIKSILNPLHELAKEQIKIKKINKKEINLLEEINFWKYNDDLSINSFLKPIIDDFSERIIKPFGQIIIPKIKEIYEKNPTVKTALLLAKIGIPSLPFLEILEPPPNVELEQTKEEIDFLEPLEKLLVDINKIYEELDKNFISTFLKDRIINSELSNKLIDVFKIKIEYGNNNFDLTIKNNMRVKDLRFQINELISKKEKICEKVIFVYLLDPSSTIILMKIDGKYVEADDKNLLSDYDLSEGSNIKILPKMKTA